MNLARRYKMVVTRSVRSGTKQRHAIVRAFTLIELLAVIAIIGVLAAILIPSVNSARVAAHKARTRVQFSQWAAAIESFRSEYGYYPIFDPGNLVNPAGQSSAGAALHQFHDLLVARRRDGSALPPCASTSASPPPPEVQNRKRISFCAFSEAEFTDSNLIRDAFGNTEIAVIVDRNLDGVVSDADAGGVLPLVAGMRPGAADFPTNGVRSGVVFYVPAPGATPEAPLFVCSWK